MMTAKVQDSTGSVWAVWSAASCIHFRAGISSYQQELDSVGFCEQGELGSFSAVFKGKPPYIVTGHTASVMIGC